MEQVRINSRRIHPEVEPLTREQITESLKAPRITLPFITDYELAVIIGIRAQQIADGAKPLVSLDGLLTSSPRFVWEVAERELNEKKLPFLVNRRFPLTEKSEVWSLTELNII